MRAGLSRCSVAILFFFSSSRDKSTPKPIFRLSCHDHRRSPRRGASRTFGPAALQPTRGINTRDAFHLSRDVLRIKKKERARLGRARDSRAYIKRTRARAHTAVYFGTVNNAARYAPLRLTARVPLPRRRAGLAPFAAIIHRGVHLYAPGCIYTPFPVPVATLSHVAYSTGGAPLSRDRVLHGFYTSRNVFHRQSRAAPRRLAA